MIVSDFQPLDLDPIKAIPDGRPLARRFRRRGLLHVRQLLTQAQPDVKGAFFELAKALSYY